MKRVISLILLSIVLQAPERVHAQWFFPAAVGLGAYGGGWGGYGYGGMGGTVGGSYGHAMADVIRSQGMYNQMSSQSMINYEDARSKYIQNEKDWTDVYLMQRRIREADKAQAVENQRAASQRYASFQAQRPSHLPPRLSSSQLEPSTGRIIWPSALMQEPFAEQRDELQKLFTTRVHTGTTSDLSTAITQQVAVMFEALRDRIREIPTPDYMEARKFLNSLAQEGRSPVF